MKPFTFGSLFAGIGGFDLGLERAGMVCRWQVEIDPFCQKVLRKHWPKVPKYGDIRELTGKELEPVDLICGGFPCQDISSSGKKVGITGQKSGLWGEMLRVIRMVRPRFILVENVSMLLSSGLDRVLGDLAESRYDAEWQSLQAASFGAPHLRDRVFILGYTNQDRQPNGSLNESKASWVPPILQDSERNAWSQLREMGRAWRQGEPVPWITDGEGQNQPGTLGVDDGIPNRMDRLRGLGNALLPQQSEFIGKQLLAALR